MKCIRLHGMAALVLICCMGLSTTQAADITNAEGVIQTLISKTYDTPEARVETQPVVVGATYAVADWVQGDRGGRALLRKTVKQASKSTAPDWEIVLCAGDGLRTPEGLAAAGVPKEEAKSLAKRLQAAESRLPVEKVKRFGVFGTPDDPKFQALNHSHHH